MCVAAVTINNTFMKDMTPRFCYVFQNEIFAVSEGK